MRIGKTKYLSLLSLATNFDEERTLIVKPLIEVYEKITTNAREQIQQYEDEIANSIDTVVDDETNTTSHDLLDSTMQNISFEYSLQISSISASLIIVAQSYLHSKFQNVISAYEYFKTPYNAKQLQRHFFSLGEKVSGVPWAEAVKAASNYVRHFEEWRVRSSIYEKIDGHMIVTKLTNLIAQLSSKNKESPKTLISLGFSEEEVFDKLNNLTPRIVEKLRLTEVNEFAKCATIWINEVSDELHRNFDHIDK